MLVSELRLSTGALLFRTDAPDLGGHHDWLLPGPQHSRESGLIVAAAPDVQVELAVGEVICVTSVDDGCAHTIARRRQQQLVNDEVDVAIPLLDGPRSDPAGVGS